MNQLRTNFWATLVWRLQLKILIIFNNYWIRFFVIFRIIRGEVSIISQSRKLRLITLSETLIILYINKPNSITIIVLLYIERINCCPIEKNCVLPRYGSPANIIYIFFYCKKKEQRLRASLANVAQKKISWKMYIIYETQ